MSNDLEVEILQTEECLPSPGSQQHPLVFSQAQAADLPCTQVGGVWRLE